MNPIYKKCIYSLIKQNIENKILIDALVRNLEFLVNISHNESHINIRTFLFFLEKKNPIEISVKRNNATIIQSIILMSIDYL